MNIVGVSALYHDSAAALITPTTVKAAAEERFTRIKHDNNLPEQTLQWLKQYVEDEIDYLVFYERPLLKLDRIQALRKGHIKNWKAYHNALREWSGYKLWVRPKLQQLCEKIELPVKNTILFTNHHQSHAASAFYPSEFEEAAILCLDGVGEWETGSIAHGKNDTIKLMRQQIFPHSIGLFYAAMTSIAGFKVNSGEYKLMGLAPYGKPIYSKKLQENVIKINENGGVELDLTYFGFLDSGKMYSPKMCELLFNTKTPLEMVTNNMPTNIACDIAASAQEICNIVLEKSSRYAVELTGSRNLALAGGVALNAVSVGYILEKEIVDKVFVQPAASDAGGALGAAMAIAADKKTLNRDHVRKSEDSMNNSFLGYCITNTESEKILQHYKIPYSQKTREEIDLFIAEKIHEGKIIGLARGEMEYGARALGNRSILANPSLENTQEKLNKAVKKRESFRPFAPAIMEEKQEDWFEYPYGSKYMTQTCKIKKNKRYKNDVESENNNETNEKNEKLYVQKYLKDKRSDCPAVTHVDYSARAQSVDNNNPMYKIISHYYKLSGYPMVVNTSFNLRGEPIVCTEEDAVRCFASSDMDYLILADYIIDKKNIENSEIPLVEVKLD